MNTKQQGWRPALTDFLRTPFGLAVAGLVVLAGWALWTAGIFDNDLQTAARSGSIYAAEGVELDTDAAAEVIGNRRLFVAFLSPDEDLGDACDETSGPADGTLVVLLSAGEGAEDYDVYGCSRLPGAGDENFGEAYVAESVVSRGVDAFVDRPLEAVKVITVNYDRLVKTGHVPDHAREISPSLPRYLIALAAIAAVLLGSVLAYAGARRAGKLAAQRADNRASADDARSSLNAKSAVLAQQIIDLDKRYTNTTRYEKFGKEYRRIVSDYTDLVADLAQRDGDSTDDRALHARVDALNTRCRKIGSG